jgi:hypothetical protein
VDYDQRPGATYFLSAFALLVFHTGDFAIRPHLMAVCTRLALIVDVSSIAPA